MIGDEFHLNYSKDAKPRVHSHRVQFANYGRGWRCSGFLSFLKPISSPEDRRLVRAQCLTAVLKMKQMRLLCVHEDGFSPNIN